MKLDRGILAGERRSQQEDQAPEVYGASSVASAFESRRF